MTAMVALVPAVMVLALLILGLRVPRSGWTALAAAVVLGLAGYAWQGHPGLPGAPRLPDEVQGGGAAVSAQQAMASNTAAGMDGNNRWMVIADAFLRNNQFADAVPILRAAVEHDPKNSDAWLRLGNALIMHAQGNPSPAGLLALRRAAQANPAAPGPPFYLGMAMLQLGKPEAARQYWAQLLARSPANARWRPDLARRLAELDWMMAAARKRGVVAP